MVSMVCVSVTKVADVIAFIIVAVIVLVVKNGIVVVIKVAVWFVVPKV